MTFDEWFKNTAEGNEPPTPFWCLMRAIREAAWNAATAAERERCAKALDDAAAPLLKARNQVDRHTGDVLQRKAETIRAGTP